MKLCYENNVNYQDVFINVSVNINVFNNVNINISSAFLSTLSFGFRLSSLLKSHVIVC